MKQNFADLRAPIASQLFFAEHREAKPLHIRRNDEHFYDRLISNRVVETLITPGRLRFTAIRLVRDNAFFAAESFTRNIRSGKDVFAGVPDIARIKKAYGAGATISLPGIHRSRKRLADLVAAIEGEFGHAANANIYLTPGNAKGFTPHYDTHELCASDCRTQALLSEPPIPLSHRTQPCSPRGWGVTPPVVEAKMKPGDLLYLPCVFVHTRSTSEKFSVHVTLGITVYTWIEVLTEWLQAAKLDERFRRALPPGFAGTEANARALKEKFTELSASRSERPTVINWLKAFSPKSGR